MAKAKKRNPPVVQLEMRWGGLFSLALVAFCLMLWMFLFGIWTGQTVLQRPTDHDLTGRYPAHDDERVELGAVPRIKAAETVLNKGTKQTQAWAAVEKKSRAVSKDSRDVRNSSFYAIQVAAYKEVAGARRAVAEWRARDYEAFYLLPPAGSSFNRVFVGHIVDLPAAKKMAANLEDRLKTKVFINLIAGKVRRYN
ncbi:MAG: SPOR domain-containing protein [Deltaproteobacteria bacterium]|nr:SPOR domain-containing protein [Deltaproteobacteria bacterium]